MNTSTRTVTSHTTAVAFFEARRAELIEAAVGYADRAEQALASGATEFAAELLAFGRDAMAQVARIDACKVA